ncbi:hypothetical protein L596_006810 [Steinernema carpocapsae]|uniref:Uncharacterized protein n=1 Tax=Steinernema carpocapsae TaxID=34508 RepID=A0A4U5P8A8_STECR|nr:hypothetical protein L596_006810 [Steinernema carpocapsae]
MGKKNSKKTKTPNSSADVTKIQGSKVGFPAAMTPKHAKQFNASVSLQSRNDFPSSYEDFIQRSVTEMKVNEDSNQRPHVVQWYVPPLNESLTAREAFFAYSEQDDQRRIEKMKNKEMKAEEEESKVAVQQKPPEVVSVEYPKGPPPSLATEELPSLEKWSADGGFSASLEADYHNLVKTTVQRYLQLMHEKLKKRKG